MHFSSLRRFAAPALLTLSACAGSVGSYPSLAPRPAEQGAAPATVAEAAPAAPDPALSGRAAALTAQAARGEAAMAEATRIACPALARGRGAREGSEAWIAAQQALSAVEAARRETSTAREDIDALVLEQARLAQEQPRPVDLSALLAAADGITARDTAQDARLQAMRAGDCPG